MFSFHQDSNPNQDQQILSITLPNGIPSEFQSKLNLQHCTFASDINWADKSLCATVYIVNLNLAQFLIREKDMFNVGEVCIVSSAETGVAEISLLSGKHMDPLEYIALLSGDEDQQEREEDRDERGHDSA